MLLITNKMNIRRETNEQTEILIRFFFAIDYSCFHICLVVYNNLDYIDISVAINL